MAEIIRVLHVLGSMGQGGAENFLMNLYRNLDYSKIQFDFLVNRKGIFDDEIIERGGKVFYIPELQKIGQYKYIKNLDKFLNENHNYKIIHSHLNQVTGLILERAKKANIPIRISHSHNSKSAKNMLVRIYKKYLGSKIEKNANYFLACSDKAAKWLYPHNYKQAIIIKNAIDIDKFKYNEAKREKIREELHITDDTIVLGHIGRFFEQKNHLFLIDIFNEIHKIDANIKLVLCGDGELREEIQSRINRYNLDDNVILLGNRGDIDYIYQAFDLFVFPSKYEGLPLVLIEAQTSGLYIFASNTISKEVDITGNIEFVDLNENPKYWANRILDYKNTKRKDINKKIEDSGYDAKMVAIKMMDFYEEVYKK